MRVIQIIDQHRHMARLPRGQPARQQIGAVIQLVNGVHDALAHLGRDVFRVVHHIGDGRDRYAGALRHIPPSRHGNRSFRLGYPSNWIKYNTVVFKS